MQFWLPSYAADQNPSSMRVVTNAKRQLAIVPACSRLPPGWVVEAGPASIEQCRDFVRKRPHGWLTQPDNDVKLRQLFSFDKFMRDVLWSDPRPATVQGDHRLTYPELRSAVDRLAEILQKRGVSNGTRVAVLMDRSTISLVSMLAVWSSGAVYVPIDPYQPRTRIEGIIKSTSAELVMALDRQGMSIPLIDMTGWNAIGVNFEAEPATQLASTANGLAYLIATSGTTSVPKVVAVPHSALWMHVATSRSSFDLRPSDIVLQLGAISGDSSIEQSLLCLQAAATLVYPPTGKPSSDELLQTILKERVSGVDFTPNAFETILGHATRQNIVLFETGLRQVVIGGDVFPPSAMARAHDSQVDLVNAYGPTEGVVTSSIFRFRGRWGAHTVPIGAPLPGRTFHIVGMDGNTLAAGDVGMLLIGGPMLANGYLDDPVQTAERFQPDPFNKSAGSRLYVTGDLASRDANGLFNFIGRADSQVKLRGYRVEIEEVEAALRSMPGVTRAVAVVMRAEPSASRLIGIVATPDGDGLNHRECLTWLSARLPPHMVPSALFRIDQEQLDGQFGREELVAEIAAVLEDDVPARSLIEECLLECWRLVLQSRDFGVTSNFFDLGGDSLSAVQVAADVQSVFGVAIGDDALFEMPTIRQLAKLVEELIASKGDYPDWKTLPTVADNYPVTVQQRCAIAQARTPFVQSLIITGPLDSRSFVWAMRRLVGRHDVLSLLPDLERNRFETRTRFRLRSILELHDISADAPRKRRSNRNLAVDKFAEKRFMPHMPLFHCSVLKLAARRCLLMLKAHPLIADGWTLGILLRDLSRLYFHKTQGCEFPPAPVVSYGSYAQWQSVAAPAMDEYSAGRIDIAGCSPDSDAEAVVFEPAVHTRLMRLAAATASSIESLLLAAAVNACYEVSGKRTVIIVLTSSGRDADLQNVAGPIAIETTLIVQVAKGTTMAELLRTTKQLALRNYLRPADLSGAKVRGADMAGGEVFVLRFEYGASRTLMGASHRIRSLKVAMYTGDCSASVRVLNDGTRLTAVVAAPGYSIFSQALRNSLGKFGSATDRLESCSD